MESTPHIEPESEQAPPRTVTSIEGSRLPVDVLFHVMSHASSPTIRATMETCRALNDQGTKYLIRNGVVLRNDRDVTSFSNLIAAKGKAYLAFLQKLTIAFGGVYSDSPEWVSQLAQLLASPESPLDTLVLHASDPLLTASLPIWNAIQSRRSIRHLVLHQAGEPTRLMLSQSRSSLVSAHISAVSSLAAIPGFTSPAELLQANPVSVLNSSAETLEELKWTQTDYLSSVLAQPIPLDLVVQRYPRVRSFTLNYGFAQVGDPASVPNMSPFIRAFPNLTIFSVFPTDPLPSMDAREMDFVLRTRRSRHLEAHPRPEEGGPWPALQELSGGLYALYALAYTPVAAVPTVRIRSCTAFPGVWEEGMLLEVLSGARPTAVDIHVLQWCRASTWQPPKASIVQVLRKLEPCTIRTLRLEIMLGSEAIRGENAATIDELLEDLIPAFSSLPPEVSTLDLTLDWRILSGVSGPSRPPSSWTWDPVAFARRLKGAIPTLSHVSVDLVKDMDLEAFGIPLVRFRGAA
ncbi:hypothetical protein C8Q76DRAFT_781306 [Earliella scabrosa]|nr:hypothetical protein C8Q76DRAFT_781306 [Earliella scabrosa]